MELEEKEKKNDDEEEEEDDEEKRRRRSRFRTLYIPLRNSLSPTGLRCGYNNIKNPTTTTNGSYAQPAVIVKIVHNI